MLGLLREDLLTIDKDLERTPGARRDRRLETEVP